jgi:AmiR/NasT family two-component response regulator
MSLDATGPAPIVPPGVAALHVALWLPSPACAEVAAALVCGGHRVQVLASAAELCSTPDPGAEVALVGLQALQSSALIGDVAKLSLRLPVVLVSAEARRALVWPAEDVRAVALLLLPLDPASLLASLPLWVERHRELRALRVAEAGLVEALAASRHIGCAVGMLAERHHISADAAFGRLRSQARSRRLRTEQVAQAVVAGEDITA